MKKSGRRQAFTLVELLIVIIVIAVIAAIAIPKFQNASLRSKESALRGELKLLRDAIDRYHSDTGFYPAGLNELTFNTAPVLGLDGLGNIGNINATNWHGPYIGQIDVDPIDGTQFTYVTPTPNTGKVHATTGTATDGTDYSTW